MLDALRLLSPCLLAASCASEPARAAPPAQEQQPAEQIGEDEGKLTLERILELARTLRPQGQLRGWMPDGKSYLWVDERPPQPAAPEALEKVEAAPGVAADDTKPKPPASRIQVVDVAGGASRPLYDAARMQAAFADLPGIDEGTARRWSTRTRYDLAEAKDAVLLNEANDLFHYRFGADRAVRVTNDPAEEVGETLSPDGKLVAYIRDWNLWVAPVDGGPARALTSEGDENHLFGRLDWVYQEEVYGRGNFGGFWWSPDSKRIAFLVLDETEVPEYTVVDHRPVRPDVEVWRYPKAGDPNPKAKLALVDVAGGPLRYVDLDRYGTQEILIVRVGWRPDGERVVFQVQDRIQTWLDLLEADPRSGKVERLFRDATAVWIEPSDAPYWIEGGKRFLWLSERDGWRHLYLYEQDGKLARRLTEGEWEIDGVHGVDEEAGVVYVDADKDDVRASRLFRLSLEGGELEPLTPEPGSHRISMAPGFEHYIDTFSSAADPGRIELVATGGAVVRVLEKVDDEPARKARLAPLEFVTIPARDGFELEGFLIKPAGFEPGKRYPVMCYTYAGPHAPQVRDTWQSFNLLFHQMLAQEGYLTWVLDNRTASGKGLASAAPAYRNMGPSELRDIEDGLDWLVAQGLADPERIGIWGWSYGGYMTAFALTHSKRFKLGIAGAPVTDWRLYDTIYTERYMGLPQEQAEAYDAGSVIAAAADLSGKLLLIHGTIDENVHVQNTLQLAEALQKAGKPFQMMLYPGNRHGVVQPDQRKHLYATMAEFIRANL